MSEALVVQHAVRMRHIVLSSVVCPAVPYFSTLSHKRHDFQEKFIEHKLCGLIFFKFCLELFQFQEEFGEILSQMCTGLNVKCLLFLWDFNETWIFSTYFRKILKNQFSWKFRPVGAELFQVDVQTDITKLAVVFRNSANAHKNSTFRPQNIHLFLLIPMGLRTNNNYFLT